MPKKGTAISMILIIGGAYQGKHTYLAQKYPGLPADRLFDYLHLWVRAELEAGRDPLDQLTNRLTELRNTVILCEDIFCGVVPLDPMERRWREATGRCCALAAAHADQVVRLFCGIPTLLK